MERLILSDISCTKTVYNSVSTTYQHASPGAIIININDTERDYVSSKIKIDTLDNYCGKNNIHPSFLKIDAGGNELKLLKGALSIH